jgi:hypothetical protein
MPYEFTSIEGREKILDHIAEVYFGRIAVPKAAVRMEVRLGFREIKIDFFNKFGHRIGHKVVKEVV